LPIDREFVPNARTHVPASSKALEMNELVEKLKLLKISTELENDASRVGIVKPDENPMPVELKTIRPIIESVEPMQTKNSIIESSNMRELWL